MGKELIKRYLEHAVNNSVELNKQLGRCDELLTRYIKYDLIFYRGMLLGFVLTDQITAAEKVAAEAMIKHSLENSERVDLGGIFDE